MNAFEGHRDTFSPHPERVAVAAPCPCQNEICGLGGLMAGGPALSTVLVALAADTQRERVSVGDLLLALGDRASAALMFIFAFPNVLPTPPGTSTLLGAPLVFLAAQLMLGRSPWLPAVVATRSMVRSDFSVLVKRIVPWLVRAEKLLRPRWSGLTRSPMENLVGLLAFVLAVLLVLPIPLGNVLPALAISLLALGVLERDGAWVLAGIGVAAAGVFVVSGVVFAMFKAAMYFMTEIL